MAVGGATCDLPALRTFRPATRSRALRGTLADVTVGLSASVRARIVIAHAHRFPPPIRNGDRLRPGVSGPAGRALPRVRLPPGGAGAPDLHRAEHRPPRDQCRDRPAGEGGAAPGPLDLPRGRGPAAAPATGPHRYPSAVRGLRGQPAR